MNKNNASINKETVYLSAYLRETDYGKPVFNQLVKELETAGYGVKIIVKHHNNNEWCRDYMPIKASDGSLVKFKYEPGYLMEAKKWRKTIPDTDKILLDMNIEVNDTCDLKLDGGAIEIHGRTGIISNRVIMENQPSSEKEICNKIKDKLKLDRIVIIPIHPDDFTGHVDGTVRFINEHKVIISYDKDVLKDAVNLHTYKRKLIEQFYYSLRMSLYNAGLEWEYLTYAEGVQEDEKNQADNFNLYMNFLNLKDHIFMPSYNTDYYDEKAVKDLERFYPDKEIVPVLAKELSKQGGMINCVTWQL